MVMKIIFNYNFHIFRASGIKLHYSSMGIACTRLISHIKKQKPPPQKRVKHTQHFSKLSEEKNVQSIIKIID